MALHVGSGRGGVVFTRLFSPLHKRYYSTVVTKLSSLSLKDRCNCERVSHQTGIGGGSSVDLQYTPHMYGMFYAEFSRATT